MTVEPILREVDERLRATYRPTRLGNPRDPLSDLVFLVLSAQTEEYNYVRTYAALRRRFPTWRAAMEAGPSAVFRVIRRGGLARKKARQIVGIFRGLARRRGTVSLRWLRRLTDDKALRELEALPGVGAKTARCVLAYALDRATFPVDTHVWRVLGRLGLTDGARLTAASAVAFERRVPAEMRVRLHVNLVLHGRAVCRSLSPACDRCALADMCPGVARIDQQGRVLAMRPDPIPRKIVSSGRSRIAT